MIYDNECDDFILEISITNVFDTDIDLDKEEIMVTLNVGAWEEKKYYTIKDKISKIKFFNDELEV